MASAYVGSELTESLDEHLDRALAHTLRAVESDVTSRHTGIIGGEKPHGGAGRAYIDGAVGGREWSIAQGRKHGVGIVTLSHLARQYGSGSESTDDERARTHALGQRQRQPRLKKSFGGK